MSDFSIDFSVPEHGWMTVRVTQGDAGVDLDVSDVPCNSIEMLIWAAHRLAEGSETEPVPWSLEPLYAEWKLKLVGDQIELVVAVNDVEKMKVLVDRDHFFKMLTTVLRQHRQNLAEQGEEHWSWPFPSESFDRLTRA